MSLLRLIAGFLWSVCIVFQLHREFVSMTNNVTISSALSEWERWEEKLLMLGQVEARYSKALEKKCQVRSKIGEIFLLTFQ